jgi:hypothetical protein
VFYAKGCPITFFANTTAIPAHDEVGSANDQVRQGKITDPRVQR